MIEFEDGIDCGVPKTASATFTGDDIRRVGLPPDVFRLLYDLCYHHGGRDVQDYVRRAQALLMAVQSSDEMIYVGDLQLCPRNRTARRGGRVIHLSARECALLEYLMRNAGRCVTREMVIEHVWQSSTACSNVVDVYINYLRAKVDKGETYQLIRTVRGMGYQLRENSYSWQRPVDTAHVSAHQA